MKSFLIRALFENEESYIRAARFLYEKKCHSIQGYSPVPVDELNSILGETPSPIPRITFIGGLTGALLGYGGQQWAMALNYPHNIGGRPLYSWPLFLPITFELLVLFSATTALFSLLIILRLPKLYQPYLNSSLSRRSSHDAYVIEAIPPAPKRTDDQPQSMIVKIETELQKMGAVETEIVEEDRS